MKDWGHMKFENEREIACWNTFQAKHSVTHGNWITIIIMLIHWYTDVNNLSLPLVLEFAVYFNKMKDWGHMKFENESEIACWNTFQAKHSVTHGNWITIIIMLIHWYTYVNNLSLPLVLEFAVYFNKMKDWGHMKFENESEIACWNTFQAKHGVTHGNWMTIIIMLIQWYTYVNYLFYL